MPQYRVLVTKQFKSYSNFLTISSHNCLAVVSSSMLCFDVYNFQLFCRFIRPWLLDIWRTKTITKLFKSCQSIS